MSTSLMDNSPPPPPKFAPSGGIYAAFGLHLGFLLVAVAALVRPAVPRLTPSDVAVLAGVGLALLIWAAVERGHKSTSSALRALVGLGAALLLGLAHAPRLTPYLGLGGDSPYARLPITLGTLGAVLAFLCWVTYRASGGEAGRRPAPLRWAVVVSLVLVLALSSLMYGILAPRYAMSAMDLGTLSLAIQALQMSALLVVVLGASGGPLVGRLPAIYFGLALLVAAVLGVLPAAGVTP